MYKELSDNDWSVYFQWRICLFVLLVTIKRLNRLIPLCVQ